MEPFRLRRGYACAWLLLTSRLAAATLRSALNTSGRCAKVWAGMDAIDMKAIELAAIGALVARAVASFCLNSGSDAAVSATSTFKSRSHCPRCWVTRLPASAALARASASCAGAVKPARVVKADRRAVSRRELASVRVRASCSAQARRLMYWLATSAATDTRASCHCACALS